MPPLLPRERVTESAWESKNIKGTGHGWEVRLTGSLGGILS